jgi:hypothetical protein
VTVSVGAAAIEVGETKSATDLLQVADERLYDAKRAGRNRVIPSPRAEIDELLASEDTPIPTGVTRELLL